MSQVTRSAEAVTDVSANQTTNLTPSIGRRMASWFYEGLLMFGVVFIAGYLFSTLSQTRHALDNRHALQAFLFVVFAIYFTWFWHKGQTLAMKTWHIRVVDAITGQPITQKRAFARYVLSWLWLLPPLPFAALIPLTALETVALVVIWVVVYAQLSRLHPDRQFWHDAWAGTRLVQKN